MQSKLWTPLLIALAASLAPLGHALAQVPANPIEFKNSAEMEIEVTGPDGKVERKRGPVQKAVPGKEVIYTSTFKNVGTKPAGGIAINNPVPPNTTLVPGSVYGENTEISYSADGGKTWANVARVTVKSPDGKERPAGISEFTNIRWTYRGDLAPGKQGSVGFRVTIN